MIVAGAKDLGDDTWKWDGGDFLFQLWRQARAALPADDGNRKNAERLAFNLELVLPQRWNDLHEIVPDDSPDSKRLDDVRERIDGFRAAITANQVRREA